MSHWATKNPQVISFQAMRRWVGWLAILLPLATAVGYAVLGAERGGFLQSISEAYYTIMRDVFVGTLFAVAFFLFAYKGYNDFEDRLFGGLASLCVVIACVSTNPQKDLSSPGFGAQPPACHAAIEMDPTCLILLNDRTLLLHHDLYGYVHLAAAALLFLILGYVSFALFTRTDPSGAKAATKEKLRRNRIYRVCGIVIWLSLAAYGIYALAAWISPAAAGVVWLDHWRWFLFAVEATCLVAFGFSWLLKGDGVPGLADADAADR